MQFSDEKRELRNFNLNPDKEQGIHNHQMNLNKSAKDENDQDDINQESVKKKANMEGVINKMSFSSFESYIFPS